MRFLNENRNADDLQLLGKICFDTITQDIPDKPNSDEFCGVYYEGRPRCLNCIEDLAAIKSFKLFSQYNYPILVFCSNFNNFLNNHSQIEKWRIKHIQIPEITSHDAYSQFFIKEIFNLIPEKYENLLFHHPDGFLIKNGWEEHVTKNKLDYAGGAWCHLAGIDIYRDMFWYKLNFPSISVGNGGFSFRRRSPCLKVSKMFGNYILRETGREDSRPPPEDLFYSNILNGLGYKVANRQEANDFSLDPINLQEYQSKCSFGFHYPQKVNEFQKFRDKYL